MKTLLTSCALAVPLLALNVQAATSPATVAWKAETNTATHFLWSEPNNWAPNRVPTVSATGYGDKADFNANPQPPCFIDGFAFPAQYVIGDNQPGHVIILNGGTLINSNYDLSVNSWSAVGYNHMCRVEVRTGGNLVATNHLWVGLNYNARANLVLNGGTVTVRGMIGIGWSGGIGLVQVNNGTMNLYQWNPTASIGPLSQMDIRGGTVFIWNTNDYTASIANYVAGGQITAYGGFGTVNYTYDTNNFCTIVTATPGPAGSGGPYAPTTWPGVINPNLFVHYWTADPNLTAPNASWLNSMGVLTSGESANTDINFKGLPGKQCTATYFNVWDQNWQAWNTNGLVDVLMCVYGDANLMRSIADQNQCRRFRFELGNSPTDSSSRVYGWQMPTNAINSQWNWMLFTITNNFQSNLVDRLMGSLRTNATSTGTNYGGINGGTMRIDTLDGGALNLSVRAIAFGQHGAFGNAADINRFALPDGSCPMVLNANLVGIDFNAGYTNYLQPIDMTAVTGVGPVGDQRNAVLPNGQYFNFGILSNYLGQPCNDNVAMKVCLDYYDDPALKGEMFGPYVYATDGMGGVAYYPIEGLATLQGTGQWLSRSWTIGSVNLKGVSLAPPLTGGPQFICSLPIAISRCDIAVLRTSGPLAGQDPLAGCYQDPNVCLGVYSNYAELDLGAGITNGVDVGSSGGDQSFVVEMAGPVSDQRLSVCPTNTPNHYLNFQLSPVDSLGPQNQGNVYLAMFVTYYDDPALAGATFRPDVWNAQTFSTIGFAYMSSAENMVLQGTGQWREAYWEIGSIYLKGVGQANAAARLWANAPIHISRIRYAVIRPCGPTAGQNLLSNKVPLTAAPDTNGLVKVSWPLRAPQAALQGVSTLGGAWTSVGGTKTIEGGDSYVLRVIGASPTARYFRLNLDPK